MTLIKPEYWNSVKAYPIKCMGHIFNMTRHTINTINVRMYANIIPNKQYFTLSKENPLYIIEETNINISNSSGSLIISPI